MVHYRGEPHLDTYLVSALDGRFQLRLAFDQGFRIIGIKPVQGEYVCLP